MRKFFTHKLYVTTLVVSLIIFFFIFADMVSAREFQPIVGLPGLDDKNTRTLPEYLNAIYILIIGLGALIGVIKISMAGVKYSMSDIVTSKAEAKKDIGGVLLGLAILLIPFLVLNTINPNLTNLDVLTFTPTAVQENAPSCTQVDRVKAAKTILISDTNAINAFTSNCTSAYQGKVVAGDLHANFTTQDYTCVVTTCE